MNKTKMSMQIRRMLKFLAPPAALPPATLPSRCGISSEIKRGAAASELEYANLDRRDAGRGALCPRSGFGFPSGLRPHSKSIRKPASSSRARLRGEPDRRICGTEQIIVVSLHDFEEEAIAKGGV
jgi:hypothetical protein